MSITYSADVFCDSCGDWVHGVTSKKSTGLDGPARKAAKEKGWERDRATQRDLCPRCRNEVAGV